LDSGELGFGSVAMPALFAGPVANQSEKRYRTESFLKRISAYPEVNSQAMRPKQVTSPVKDGDHKEIQGKSEDSSSGSEHGSECTSFTDMVCGLMDFDEEIVCSHCNCSNGDGESCSENEPEDPHSTQILESVVSCMTAAELALLGCVKDAVGNQENMEVNSSKSCLRREVMKHLKALGYNAGICKSRWESIRDFPSGEYEYLDVIMETRRGKSKDERFLVDIDFRAQFEMARPTKEYSAMVELLPNIFVGKAEKINQIIRIMCDAAKRSLKKKTMHIPPWRKYRYMRSKWLGSYKRTTNPVPVSISNLPPSSRTLNPAGAMEQNCFEINFLPLALGEWKPPSVNHKSKSPAMNAGGKVSGLASALIRAGLTNSFSKVQPTH